MHNETIVYYVPRTMDKHTTQFLPVKLNLLITIRCALSWKSVEDAYQARSLKP